MSAAEPAQRPRAVTVLGWVFLVVSVLYFLRSALNLMIFEVVQAAAPELILRLSVVSRPWVPEWMFRHSGAIYLCQAAVSAAVAVCAWGFLALKPWARRSLQIVCWLLLALDAGLAFFWVRLWTGFGERAAAFPSTSSRHGQMLYAGLFIFAGWAALVSLALFFMRSRAVRLAFAAPSSAAG